MVPVSVERCLQLERVHPTFAGPAKLSSVQAGKLTLTSGKLAAGDAHFLMDAVVFKESVPRGEHGVMLTIAQYPDGDQRVAAARIELAKAPVKTWKAATPEIFVVEGGVAGLADATSVKTFAQMPAEQQQKWWRQIAGRLEKNYRDTRSFAQAALPPGNVVAFSSGFGDGGYGVYFGYDASKKLICVLADFGLLLTQDEIDEMQELRAE